MTRLDRFFCGLTWRTWRVFGTVTRNRTRLGFTRAIALVSVLGGIAGFAYGLNVWGTWGLFMMFAFGIWGLSTLVSAPADFRASSTLDEDPTQAVHFSSYPGRVFLALSLFVAIPTQAGEAAMSGQWLGVVAWMAAFAMLPEMWLHEVYTRTEPAEVVQ